MLNVLLILNYDYSIPAKLEPVVRSSCISYQPVVVTVVGDRLLYKQRAKVVSAFLKMTDESVCPIFKYCRRHVSKSCAL